LSVGLFRFDFETEEGCHSVSHELDWDTPFRPHRVPNDFAVAVKKVQEVLREQATGTSGPSKADKHHSDFPLNGLFRNLGRG
jgi:hypothetical protein